MDKIEYRVRPVTRFVVTRWHSGDNGGGIETFSEYENAAVAYDVAYALCKAEHGRLGWPPGDERITYPSIPDGVSVPPATVVIPAASVAA